MAAFSKITRPTDDQRRSYAGIGNLHGYITVDGHQCIVEAKRNDPVYRYEVLAPDGMIFSEGPSSLNCEDMADLRERLQHATLEPDTDY